MAINCLLDTHVILWWLFDSPQLSLQAKKYISDSNNRILVSSVSGWEISIKHQLGKLPEIGDVLDKFSSYIQKERFEELPISIEHALLAGKLPLHHKDPFDRMLIAQAMVEQLLIISTDEILKQYEVNIIW